MNWDTRIGFLTGRIGGLILLSACLAPRLPGQSATNATASVAPLAESPAQKRNPLKDYKFTNELGQGVSLSDFRGQVLAMTFFFTRCPMPEFCPRLSKNFQEASRQLKCDGESFTNWHFLSVTFAPAFDTPGVLKAYAERYQYD